MSGDDKIKNIFLTYANLGRGHNKTTALTSANFSKMTKDAGLVDAKLTKTDVDLIFTKFKGKGQTTLTFEQFLEALRYLAARKKTSEEEVFKAIEKLEGPKLTNVTEFSKEAWVQKQTDTDLYTGAHKYRFDREGKGRGIEGRRSFEDIDDLMSHTLDRSAADIRGRKVEDAERVRRESEEKARVAAELAERERRIKEKDPAAQ